MQHEIVQVAEMLETANIIIITKQRIAWMEQTVDEVLQDISGKTRTNKKTNESTTQPEKEETIITGRQERKKRTAPISTFHEENHCLF